MPTDPPPELELEPADAPPKRSGGLLRLLTLPFMLGLGMLVYELSESPGLAAVFMCAKFGFNDARTALWLRRTDPDRARGRACFWLYLSSGLWKTALTALAMMFLVVFLVAHARQPGQPPPPQNGPPPLFVGAVLTMLIAFLLSTLTTFRALWHGLRHNVRFWLSGRVHTARGRGVWPPNYGTVNHASVVLTTGVVIGFALVVPILLGLFFGILTALAGPIPPAVIGVSFAVVMLVVLPILLLIFKDHLVTRVHALHPEECWGIDPLPEPADAKPADADDWGRRAT